MLHGGTGGPNDSAMTLLFYMYNTTAANWIPHPLAWQNYADVMLIPNYITDQGIWARGIRFCGC